ncbi:hypothetical protein KDN32_21735 [Nocardioides sp. J2M5]|uniref:hypothetical protein n=1 Tax=Nocardioides palaemonis TaxID=2829810 RepID=UPI001BA67F3D|nr:hypothetical protein [Nocardioides palaemonis]MBS2940367.1 hypothetical protein [Nocardioides palaemonis]
MGTGVHGGRIAATVALVLAAGACSGAREPTEEEPGGTRVEAGELVALEAPVPVEDVDPEPALTARVPSGEVRVAVRAADEVEGARQQAASLDAPDGTEVVVVAWELDPTALAVPEVAARAALGTDADAEVVLTGGDVDAVLATDPLPLEGSALVAVPDAAELGLEVTFDGVVQTVSPGGERREVPAEAAGLYEGFAFARSSLDCRPARLDADCLAGAAWLPWTDAGGWAPVGQVWPVVRVDGSVPGETGALAPTVTLGDAAPVRSYDADGTAAGGFDGLHVFPAVRLGAARVDLQAETGAGRLVGTGVLVPALP